MWLTQICIIFHRSLEVQSCCLSLINSVTEVVITVQLVALGSEIVASVFGMHFSMFAIISDVNFGRYCEYYCSIDIHFKK